MIDGLVACICEGGAERTIINILLENDLLIFTEKQLLDGEILGKSDRSAKEFERRHLRKSYNEDITVIRILDSPREEFNLSKAYKDKVSVINVITSPEIEMLIIINEGKYKEYQKVKSTTKPSDFCKQTLGIKNVKSPEFIKNYFSDVNTLLYVLHEYQRLSAPISKMKHLTYLLR